MKIGQVVRDKNRPVTVVEKHRLGYVVLTQRNKKVIRREDELKKI